jgi:hypothetical protein
MKILKYHLEKLIPQVIENYGHAIVHGDGNVFIDNPNKEEKHQPSYIHREYAPIENKLGRQFIRFNSVKDIPKTVEEFYNQLSLAMAKFEANQNRILESEGIITLPKDNKEPEPPKKTTPITDKDAKGDVEPKQEGDKTPGKGFFNKGARPRTN